MTVQDRTPDRLGPYRLLEQLGEGGMGIVYLAQDSGERMVAVKALRPALAADVTARRRLAREVETMRRVDSRFVAEVIDADVTSDPPYIVTRYVPGRTLDDIVAASGPLTGAALARLACGLAAALTAVHAAGVVHRDLKPGNVMLVDGEPVVIDFGIAQLPGTTRITMTGMFMGTPGYLAPEVIEGKQGGPAADVHSWGATVAFAAAGRPPFGTGSFETIFYRIVHGQPDLDGVPAPLLWLVARALARDPSRRPAAAELSEWAAGLDAAALAPDAGAVGSVIAGGACALPAAAGTVADLPVRPALSGRPAASGVPGAWPYPTRPLAVAGAAAGAGVAGGPGAGGGAGVGAGVGAGDFRDLLPPVSYGQPAGRAGARAGAGPAAPGRAADPAARMPRSAWSPLVIAAVAVAVAASVAFPLAGTVVAVAMLMTARAGELTGRRLARRRSRQGRRTGDRLVAMAYFPLALCRSVIRFVLLAPLGLLAGGIVAATTIIAVPVHPLPLAFSYSAGALVAFYGFGPGSDGCRRPLSRLFGAARAPAVTFITFTGMAAVAVAAIVFAFSHPPLYWPAAHLGTRLAHLPALHNVINDIRQSLVRLAAHFGV